MAVFKLGRFPRRGDLWASWGVDPAGLDEQDLHTLAWAAREILPPFCNVIMDAPRSMGFCDALKRCTAEQPVNKRVLICTICMDDVELMEEARRDLKEKFPNIEEVIGVAAFVRDVTWPAWITPLFAFFPPPSTPDKRG